MAAPLKRCLIGIQGLLGRRCISAAKVWSPSNMQRVCINNNIQTAPFNKSFSTDLTQRIGSVRQRGAPVCCSRVPGTSRSLLQVCTPFANSVRTKIICSKKGKHKSVKSVINRFYRLDWGAWIRPMAGRKKHLWRKSVGRNLRAKRHVFCTKTQSRLLDKMVTRYWTKKRYYVDDPYSPYHKRTNMEKHFPEAPRFLP